MPRTPSRVQLEVLCAASVRSPPAAQAKPTSTRKGKDRRLKRGLNPVRMLRLMQALGILTYTKRCASAPQGYPGTNFCGRSERRLIANFHLVGGHRALVIAQRLDIGDREIPIVQFGQSFLQGGVQVVLKREPGRRCQDARIHAVRQPVSLVRNELDLSRRDRRTALRFILKPVPRR